MKLKLSTKMLGESLEQHCEIEFNKLRPTGFQNAYFEKDNDSRGGSKGDYIYREADDSGNETFSFAWRSKVVVTMKKINNKNTTSINGVILTSTNSSLCPGRRFIIFASRSLISHYDYCVTHQPS